MSTHSQKKGRRSPTGFLGLLRSWGDGFVNDIADAAALLIDNPHLIRAEPCGSVCGHVPSEPTIAVSGPCCIRRSQSLHDHEAPLPRERAPVDGVFETAATLRLFLLHQSQ